MDRNFILAIALSMLIFVGFDTFVYKPQREALAAAQAEAAKQASTPGAEIDIVGSNGQIASRDEVLARAPGRVKVLTSTLEGSVNLSGARLDDLRLLEHFETLDEGSDVMTLLTPSGAKHAFFLQSGVAIGTETGNRAVWTAPEGAVLTPQSPVTLTRRDNGILHSLKISVDENFMFTNEYSVTNKTQNDITVTPFALSRQEGYPLSTMANGKQNSDKYQAQFILHEGPVGVVDGKSFERKYKKVAEGKGNIEVTGSDGWVGITNKMWLGAIIPDGALPFTVKVANVGTPAAPVFGASYTANADIIPAGETKTYRSHIYAGAKNVATLRSYEKPEDEGGLGIVDFDKAVDWGNFFFLTRPIFNLLHYFAELTGNYGIAIMLLTLVIKALMFWFANKSYEMTSRMKKIQPEMVKLRERLGDDKLKQQQEMMELYKKHKINPVAGCLPVLIQMPIFYALYKVLFVTTELRHQPFFGWIQDLSAPDPTSIFNLFGLLPYDPTAIPVIGVFLGIGVLPLLMGIGMWVQMKLNPPAADPMQAQIFALMPIMFTFLFANFAAGLVLYWFWNTFLGIVQQYWIMRRNGVDVDLFENIKKTFHKKPKVEASNDNK